MFQKLFSLVLIGAVAGLVTAEDKPVTFPQTSEVWFPNKNFPKLTTPEWVGEADVECVVVLAIDDMRDPAKYESYLRPILQRLKEIDGRAPVSIMTCAVKPEDPQLQSWLQEGVSLECHTFDHPCPLLAGGDISKSKATYDKCIDLLASVPNNRPVAFRTPCCDSLNTVSPRFFSEIFNKTTPDKNFLQLDSSVFTVFTADDPGIPKELLYDEDGREKFRKYIPRKLARGVIVHDRFVNIIENYPYPYVIQNMCWEFPCMVPSDWSANHLHQPNNPDTVRDLKLALDITVMKQGVMNLVFHPHGWIKADQVVDLIDHAVKTHGKKVKFLNFKECVERLNANVLGGESLRDQNGIDSGFRFETNSATGKWKAVKRDREKSASVKDKDEGRRFADINADGHLDLILSNPKEYGVWLYDPETKKHSIELRHGQRTKPAAEDELPLIVRADGTENGFFVNDRSLCWINEDTDQLADLLQHVSFDDLLGDRLPEAKTAGAAIQSMRVSPGFRIELVAHEPLTMDPIALDWGPDGKLWVAEMADYPLGIDGRGAPGGRIRYLEDTDGDGRYDKSTLFLDKVGFPSGVLSWGKGVLVSAAPDVFYAEDTDGDGTADRREVLYSGFVEGNQQHRVNGFTRGLDNWLYLANGDSGGIITSTKSGSSVDLRGRDLRIRPESREMEAIAGASQFGRHRDDWGNWFGNNNSRPMWHYLLDDHYLRRNPNLAAPHLQRDVSIAPGAAPVFPTSKTLTRFNDFHTANRFTSACSAIVYRDNLLFGAGNSADALGSISHSFVSEPVHNLIHHEVMKSDGISFTSQRSGAETQSEFVSSSDNWFRPTMLRTGPDGALWIADMYRLVIEHPQWIPIEWQRKLNVRAGDDKGRIWRVAPLDAKLRQLPRLDRLTSSELVGQLDSSNGWQRDLVQRLLIDRADSGVIEALRAQAGNSSNALCRLHSLCTLDGLKSGLTVELLLSSLKDPHPGIRRHAVRLLESFASASGDTSKVGSTSKATEEILAAFSSLVDDPDLQVRLQLAYTLGEFSQPSAGKLLGRIARHDHGDPHLLAAVISSLTQDNLADVLAGVVQDGTLPTDLSEQLLAQATAFNHQPALVRLLLKATEPTESGSFELWQYSAVGQFLRSLGRRNETLDNWLTKLPDHTLIQTRLQTMFTTARKVIADENAPIETRSTAVRVLGQTAEDLAVLSALLTPKQPPELQSAALESIGQMKLPQVAPALLENVRSLGPVLRSRVYGILMSRDAWRDELLFSLESKSIAPSDLDATSRQALLTHKSKAVRERAAKLLAVDLNTDRVKLVGQYLPAVRAGGDAQHGSQLFAKRCAQCHKLGDVGHVVGPDLISLTDKSAEALLTAILDPNRAVEAKFLTFTAVTKSGITHQGILAAETAGSLTLRGPEAKEVTLLRSEIDELQSNAKSLMPEGLEREVSPQDAAALIAFIRTNIPIPARKTFPNNEPKVVQPDASGAITLSPYEAEIFGPTIVIEESHKNLGWWSSADDIVVWTVNIPQQGTYSFEWTYACDPQAAGNTVVIESLGKRITTRVEKTGSWDDYQTSNLGDLELPAGEVRLTMKPASRPLPAMGDVKNVVLKLKP